MSPLKMFTHVFKNGIFLYWVKMSIEYAHFTELHYYKQDIVLSTSQILLLIKTLSGKYNHSHFWNGKTEASD